MPQLIPLGGESFVPCLNCKKLWSTYTDAMRCCDRRHRTPRLSIITNCIISKETYDGDPTGWYVLEFYNQQTLVHVRYAICIRAIYYHLENTPPTNIEVI